MPEPLAAPRETSQSVFQNVTSPWMQSANADGLISETEEFPLEGYMDQVFDLDESIEVKDARMEEERDAERERQLELEKEQDLVMDKLEEESFKLCRKYFVIGCFGLPLLLLVNFFHFADELRSENGSFRIRKYLWLSLIVALLQTFVWVIWFTVFHAVDDGTFGTLSIYYSNLSVGYLV